ncbi:nucleophile aminohydrolase [Vibrio phage 2.095.A._10N.286.46.E10]|nr:nucleophile aminohydrolase [Vibrio phage 2.095.A._10N.286.46.E10]AUS02170.1 nucleophile aminohydrolase [Vibrio phage 2.095.B._10N.286.46.E10]
MTTIAYHHEGGFIAYDSRLTKGGTICSDSFEKMRVKGDVKFVMCGNESDCQSFIEHYPEFKGNYKCSGVAVKDKKAYSFCFNQDGDYEEFELSFNEAWGSGQDHAITAMDCGLTAKEAVEMAIKRDTSSGGSVSSIFVRGDSELPI